MYKFFKIILKKSDNGSEEQEQSGHNIDPNEFSININNAPHNYVTNKFSE